MCSNFRSWLCQRAAQILGPQLLLEVRCGHWHPQALAPSAIISAAEQVELGFRRSTVSSEQADRLSWTQSWLTTSWQQQQGRRVSWGGQVLVPTRWSCPDQQYNALLCTWLLDVPRPVLGSLCKATALLA